MSEVQQAADVLLMARAVDGRPSITSPLKFFEYLLTGKPMVVAEIPATEQFEDPSLSIHFYTAGSVISMMSSIGKSIQEYGFEHRSEANISLARTFSWRQRQMRLMEFVGSVVPRTTF
jgi:hypothetical protein